MLALSARTKFHGQVDFLRPFGRLASVQGLFWIGILLVSAMTTPALRGHSKISDVTYLKDVAPILERRCVGCHANGGSTIALDSYDGARASARAIRESVLERRMPPWPAAPGFGDYRNDRSLTPIEIELLTAWADGRTPLGTIGATGSLTPTHAHPDPADDAGASLRVDLPAAHPQQSQFERLTASLPIEASRSIVGWEFNPGRAGAMIQRAVFAVDGVRLGAWVPSQGAVTLPDGVSVEARARSRVTVEMQYAKSAVPSVDAGTLTLRFGSRGTPPAFLQLACGAHTMRSSVRAFAITPSARGAGDSVEVVARHRDGRIEPLSVVPHYQPGYPLTYEFRKPVSLPRGTIVDVSSSAEGCGAGLDVISGLRGR
jgi:hypothetical protein